MKDRDSSSGILDAYDTLARWCDSFFSRAHKAQKRHMSCGPGCATCCTLTSVTPLEAEVVREYLASNPSVADNIRACPQGTRAGAPALDHEMCPFLLHRECSIYPARPIICRTHGLAVRHRGVGVMPSCAMNFMDRDVDTLESDVVLDADRVTENLMRLNLAWCRTRGNEKSAGARVLFADILAES